MAIVQTNINYTHEIMMSNLHELNNTYPFIQIQNVGFSVLGKSIPVIKLGRGKKQVFYSGSIHAQEWITTVLLMKFVLETQKRYAMAYRFVLCEVVVRVSGHGYCIPSAERRRQYRHPTLPYYRCRPGTS